MPHLMQLLTKRLQGKFLEDKFAMEIIEFLERTEHKNLKNRIGFKVRRRLQEYETELKARQRKIRDIFEFENMQYNEELLLLVHQRLEAASRDRMDWINTKRMEQQRAEEELLKVKKLQRDLENCEEWRNMQTHQLLVATKEAQLHQIAEKRAQHAKEQLIERNWLAAMEQVRQEKEYQQSYENKLRKVVETSNQKKNLELHDESKKQLKQENEVLRKELHEDNMRAIALDQKSKTDEKLREWYRKSQQSQWLKSQIAKNREDDLLNIQSKLQDEFILKDREDSQIYSELDEAQRHKVRNNEWHKLYLDHCAREKQQRLQAQREHEKLYLNTGCVLKQSQKNPYGKNSR